MQVPNGTGPGVRKCLMPIEATEIHESSLRQVTCMCVNTILSKAHVQCSWRVLSLSISGKQTVAKKIFIHFNSNTYLYASNTASSQHIQPFNAKLEKMQVWRKQSLILIVWYIIVNKSWSNVSLRTLFLYRLTDKKMEMKWRRIVHMQSPVSCIWRYIYEQ